MPERHPEPSRESAREVAWAVAVFAIAVLVYANALSVPFESDDLQLIVNNEPLRTGSWRDAFLNSLWGPLGKNAPYYRPLPVLLFKASLHLFGIRPEPLHVASALLHGGASVVVFLLGRRMLAVGAAGAAAALFAVHPIHTEAVSWASGVMDVSCAFFALLAVLLHLRGTRWSRVAAAAAFLLGLLCKETAAVAPLLVVAHEWLLRRRVAWRELVPMAIAAAGYAAARTAVLGDAAGPPLLPPGEAVANVSAAIWYYASHGIVPVPLDFAPELPRHGLALALALACAVLLALALVARTGPPRAFAVLLTALPILPALYVAATTASAEKVVAERYLYLPSAGVVLLWGSLLAHLAQRVRLQAALGAGAVLLGAVLTVGRNAVWRDPVALWTASVAASPGLAYAHEGRGFALLRSGRHEEGRNELVLAGRLDPAMAGRYVSSALSARARGQSLQAIVELQTALLLDPSHPGARLELVETYRASGRYRLAADEYRVAIANAGASAEARNNLGILLAQAGDYEAALAEFDAALRQQPGNAEIQRNAARARELSKRPRAGPAAETPPGHPPLTR